MRSHIAKIGLLLLAATSAFAQLNPGTGQPPGQLSGSDPDAMLQLSPGAAYQLAMRPVEVTRRSIANWSDIEQASLAIAVKQAADACATRSAKDYSGEPLIDLSRLCALGLGWPTVVQATDQYIHEKASAKTHMAEAYAVKVDAELNLKDEPSALKDANEMLDALPYNSFVADATNKLLDYTKLLYTTDAVSLATKRQVSILKLLRASSFVGSPTTESPATSATLTTVDLYRQALALAELQQLEGHPIAAEETTAALDRAISPTLPTDDVLAIKAMRRRYAQLGRALMEITPLVSLDTSTRKPVIPVHRAITVLLLFPDWCAQCVRLARQMPENAFSVEGHQAYTYGLLVQTGPAKKLPHAADKTLNERGGFDAAYAAEYLKGTPTVTVAPSLLERFNVTDVPLLIVTDSQGVVRLIDVADETALQPGNTVDSAVALIGKHWSGESNLLKETKELEEH